MTTPTLAEAVAHLTAFRATFNRKGEVDEKSHLTAAALDVILAHVEHTQARVTAEDEVIDKLGDLA